MFPGRGRVKAVSLARLDGDSDTFGLIVMFGLGGICVEARKDVIFRAAPFDEPRSKP